MKTFVEWPRSRETGLIQCEPSLELVLDWGQRHLGRRRMRVTDDWSGILMGLPDWLKNLSVIYFYLFNETRNVMSLCIFVCIA